jgi:hypothetical protein
MQAAFRTVGTNGTTSVVQINGADYCLYPRKANLEVRFDIWYTESIAYPSPHVCYSAGHRNYREAHGSIPSLRYLNYVLDQTSIRSCSHIIWQSRAQRSARLCRELVRLVRGACSSIRGVGFHFSRSDWSIRWVPEGSGGDLV